MLSVWKFSLSLFIFSKFYIMKRHVLIMCKQVSICTFTDAYLLNKTKKTEESFLWLFGRAKPIPMTI